MLATSFVLQMYFVIIKYKTLKNILYNIINSSRHANMYASKNGQTG